MEPNVTSLPTLLPSTQLALEWQQYVTEVLIVIQELYICMHCIGAFSRRDFRRLEISCSLEKLTQRIVPIGIWHLLILDDIPNGWVGKLVTRWVGGEIGG